MNHKRPYRPDPNEHKPEYLHTITITTTGRHYTIVPGMQVSVIPRPGLMSGRYEFAYAETTKQGDLLIYADGPTARRRRRKTLRESDIKTVHIKTRP